MIEKNKIILIILICVVVIGAGIYYFSQSEDEFTNFEEAENIETKEVSETQNEEIKENTIVVHIAGEVVSPGVIELKEGARVVDAINAVNGVTEEADLSNINLAYVLEDAEKIYVPNINEKNDQEMVLTNTSNKNEKILVNINTASSEELQKIPGIGQATALKIIDYRKENGKFNVVDDIQNVSGIGSAKFSKMKEYICVK